MMSTPSRLMHSSTIFAPGSFTVSSMGAPTWPPHSSSEGGYAPLGLPRPRSGRPGAAVAPLDTPTYSTGAPTWPPHSSSEGGYAPLGLPRPRSGRPGGAGASLDHGTRPYAFGAPSAEASRARRRACAALSRAIGIMNGEQDTYVIPTL